ncbi:clan AA aspartic protease [Sphingobacterium cellulitidis]|uniref:retropepsin-like aspartic protease n=1 Tax=Sphingobacterium cellulitidis TaxID=1768011 RepID=UPI000B93FEED|nr:retropepsin-like aspartic protease [Sphingobacterium cellulitidis]OYD40954.1 clan AA aspartic protease [Sphingobacterium cellulitidis]OYD46731.1 clan AA aspartic protease [Sphingobacterium cellulitidis]
MQNIPFEVIGLQADGFHIITEIEIFDKKFKMVIDTGASKTVLDKETLLNSGINEEEFLNTDILSTGLGTNTMESFMITLPILKLADWQVKNFTAAVLDLSSINFAYNQIGLDPVIGVLGGDILKLYGARIDYRKNLLTLNQRKLNLNKRR